MPRRARSYDKHVPAPDPKFGNTKYAKFINYLMERGKKSVAQKIFYSALDLVAEKMKSSGEKGADAKNIEVKSSDRAGGEKGALEAKVAESGIKGVPAAKAAEYKTAAIGDKASQGFKDGRDIFDIALKNVAPLMEIKGRRIGGSNYQVPMEVMEPRRTALGMKWLISAARARKGAPMREKLAAEIVDAYNKQGAAIKKREDTHRMAEANKAFAHFARFGNRRR